MGGQNEDELFTEDIWGLHFSGSVSLPFLLGKQQLRNDSGRKGETEHQLSLTPPTWTYYAASNSTA